MENTAKPARVLLGQSARDTKQGNIKKNGKKNARNGENGIPAERRGHTEDDHRDCRCARNASDRQKDGFAQGKLCFRDGEESRQAECEIDDLRDENADHVAGKTDFWHERPNEKNTEGGIDDVVEHGMQLLTKSLKHTVDGRVEIHDGDERRENTDVFCRFRAFVNENAERLGKADEDSRGTDAENGCQRERATHDITDVAVLLHGFVRCRKLRKLGDDQPREG